MLYPPGPTFALNPEKMNWSKWEWHDVVASWNWKGYEGNELDIHIYNHSESVELLLNNKSLGKRATNRENEWIAKWKVPYEPGELKVVNFNGEYPVSSNQIVTADNPKAINMIADRSEILAGGYDLSYVTIELVDENGTRNPNSEELIEFDLDGPGEILAVASSNPMSTESYRKPYRSCYQGRCLVIVKSKAEKGEITLRAKSQNLPPASISIITY